MKHYLPKDPNQRLERRVKTFKERRARQARALSRFKLDYRGHIGHRVIYQVDGMPFEGTLVANHKYTVRIWTSDGLSKVISKVRVLSLVKDEGVYEEVDPNIEDDA